MRRIIGSQYPLRNEYKGEFAHGLRHGRGTFVYASGAVYSGCWKNSKKHGQVNNFALCVLKHRHLDSFHGVTENVLFQGKFIFKNGDIYEGEFIDDRMAEYPASSTISVCAPGGLPSSAEVSGKSASLLGSDMVLNIDTLLNRIPEAERRQELKQVSVTSLDMETL